MINLVGYGAAVLCAGAVGLGGASVVVPPKVVTKTVTVTVPGPVRTVPGPVKTVIKTVIKPVPGPVRTVTVPGPTVTKNVVSPNCLKALSIANDSISVLTRNIGLSADMINAFANSDSATVQADASTMSGLDGTLDVNGYFAARNVCEAGN